MAKTGRFLSRFWSDERGSIGIKYGVLIVMISLGMGVAASLLVGVISHAFESGRDLSLRYL